MEQKGRWRNFSNYCIRTVSGTTLIEIFGDRRILIEHHCGVIAYCPETINIKTTFGSLCVTGCDLCLSQMTESTLVISGKIFSVMMQGV